LRHIVVMKAKGKRKNATQGELPAAPVVAEPNRLWIAWSADDAKAPALRFFERGVELLRRADRFETPLYDAEARADRRQARREAIAAFDRAAELDPNLVGAIALRAVALLDLGEGVEGVEACDRALSFEQMLVAKASQQNREWHRLFSLQQEGDAVLERANETYDYAAWLHVLRAEAIAGVIEIKDFTGGVGPVERNRWLSDGDRYNQALADCDEALELTRRGGGGQYVDACRVKAELLRQSGRADEAIKSALLGLGRATGLTEMFSIAWNDPHAVQRLVRVADELYRGFSDKEKAERYNEGMDRAALLRAVADDYGLPVQRIERALERAAAETTAHDNTARATATPRPDEEASSPPSPSSKVQAVFGKIPPGFQTKRHSQTLIPEDAIHDPEVVQTAKDIVNANRRTKIETLERNAQETLRIARRIVRANEGRSPT
jgi:hypothetical protein